ncbi:hypothetical protein JYB88_17005 [Shewanella cyperi]|uniref:Uncharacterized protein n=1 Tax=Shewanella cyperi TaxID=2814292 RepID=A0A974XMA5_9GAMM|nr:hypothetical protein [Shewanella cyperi]QSX29858.1 hypothetical protein JYB88_17005 [Shewanella cyperi]
MKGTNHQFRKFASVKSAALLGLSAACFASLGAWIQAADDSATVACACSGETRYNNSLPASHPNNRCATQTRDLTWGSWLSGNSRSGQFHFIDLLELLNGHQDKPLDKSPSSARDEI